MTSAALNVRGRQIEVSQSMVMGVVNANAGSFSDPRAAPEPAKSIERAAALIQAGAAIIDVGGQSLASRAGLLEPEQEIELVLPVVEALVSEFPAIPVSVDTFKAPVAAAALRAGAAIINDVSGLRDPAIAALCSACGAALVIAHMPHRPKSPTSAPRTYPDICGEVKQFLQERIALATSFGVAPESVIIDPGPDFGKTPAQTLELMRGMDRLRDLNRPILLAISRKDFLGSIVERSPKQRDPATFAAIALLATSPGNIFRVHDVAGAVDVLKVVDAMVGRRQIAPDYRLPDELRHEPIPR